MRIRSASVDCSRDANLLRVGRAHLRRALAPTFPHPVCGHAVRHDRVHDDVRGDVGRRLRSRRHQRGGRLRGHGQRHCDADRRALRRCDRRPGQPQAVDRAGAGRGRGDSGADRRAAAARAAQSRAVLPAHSDFGRDVRLHGPRAARLHPRHRGRAAGRQRGRAESTRAQLGAAVRADAGRLSDRFCAGRRRHLRDHGRAGVGRRLLDGGDAQPPGRERRAAQEPRRRPRSGRTLRLRPPRPAADDSAVRRGGGDRLPLPRAHARAARGCTWTANRPIWG